MNPKIPFRNLYSNDTTNLDTCVSPYHPRGGYTGREELRASVKEVEGLADVHLIQLAHGQVPWYKSKIYSFEEHLKWWSEYFEVPYEKFGELRGGHQYIYDGGDYLADFIEACRDYGQTPFVSLRVNDEHHVEWIDTKGHFNGIHSINRFLAEHRHMMLGKDLTKWENRALNWIYPEVPAHMLEIVSEQCESYDFDGYELDFQRHPNLYDLTVTSFAERQAITEKFILDVRAVLDRTERNGKHRWLSVRVPCNLAVWDEIGLVPERLETLGVEIVNVSAFFYTDQWIDREQFVRRMPDLAVYFEMCHTTEQGVNLIETGCDGFTFRRATPNEIYTAAHLAYRAGAQGISFFNFHYYREHGCEGRGPFNEPPFEVVGNVRDRDFVAQAPQHFFLAKSWERNTQLLDRLFLADKLYSLELYAAEPAGGWQSDFRMRMKFPMLVGDRSIEVSVGGFKATPVTDISEPYEEDNAYPPLHGDVRNTRAWRVPREALKEGKNEVCFRWTSKNESTPLLVEYLDIFPWAFK